MLFYGIANASTAPQHSQVSLMLVSTALSQVSSRRLLRYRCSWLQVSSAVATKRLCGRHADDGPECRDRDWCAFGGHWLGQLMVAQVLSFRIYRIFDCGRNLFWLTQNAAGSHSRIQSELCEL